MLQKENIEKMFMKVWTYLYGTTIGKGGSRKADSKTENLAYPEQTYSHN